MKLKKKNKKLILKIILNLPKIIFYFLVILLLFINLLATFSISAYITSSTDYLVVHKHEKLK